MRSEKDVNRVIEQYSDMIRRLCMIHLKNYHDTQDIFQTVYLKYALSTVIFENEQHEKAWFIRVTINACKDLLKNFFRTHVISIDEVSKQLFELSSDNIDVLNAVRSLPPKYKNVVYLHYYEGYTAPEIANILHKNVNTIYTYLTRSKKVLYEKLGGDGYE
ncbi:RNA polymerase sigma factor [Lachnospiraceae bacterium 46-61]